MNIEKANILLEKVNALNKGIQADGKISDIEKDLMKSYIRQLYECYLEPTATTVVAPKPTVAPRSFETEVIRKKVAPIPPKEPYKAPRIIEVPKEIKQEVLPPIPPKVVPKVTPQPTFEVPKPKAEVARPKAAKNIDASKEIKELFRVKEAKDLSEKLSISPISDLTKAIALNDKLLYSNELFGGALVAFNEVIRTLNNMPGEAAAESYLIELAKQHDWGTENRKDTASDFIKLVRRKFK